MANYYGPGRGSWRPSEQAPVPRGGGRAFAASHRRQDGRGFLDTAQQQQESPFPAGQQQNPIPRRTYVANQHFDLNQAEDYSGHTELRERKKCLETLLAKSLKDRIVESENLPFEKRVTLVIPLETFFADLPPQDVPPNWGEIQEKATVTTANWIGPLGKHARDEQDSDSSEFSSDGMYGSQNRKPKPHELDFLEKLRYCYPMTIGFHAMNIYSQGNDSWCYCPCGIHMAPWRNFFGVQEFLEEKDRFGGNKLCTSKGGKRPNELVKHVETMKKTCRAHEIIWVFLNEVFKNYHEKDIRHIALEDLNSKKFHRAKKAILKKVTHIIDKLREEAEGKRLLEEKLAKAEQEKKILERVNLDMSRTLEANKGLKELLKAQDEQELDDAKIPSMKEGCEEFYTFIRLPFKHYSASTQLEVSQCFDLSILFSDWFRDFNASRTPSKSNFAFLFASFPDRDACALDNFWKVLSKWDIHFPFDGLLAGSSKKRTKQRLKTLEKENQAIDEGGVSREFLNQVWSQLGNLGVELPGGSRVALYGEIPTMGGLLPQTDEIFEDQLKYLDTAEAVEFKNRIECYYRAIGRILAHSMLLSPEDFGPVPVASHALPLLYQSVLLRDLMPDSSEYCLGSLVDHASALLDINSNQEKKEKPITILRTKLGIEKLDGEEDERQVRAKINEIFVLGRGIALEGLRDGLGLSGNVPWKFCFRSLPSKAISKIVFAQQKIREEDLFDAEGNWRFIIFQHEELLSDQLGFYKAAYKETQTLFKQGLAQLFRDKAANEPTFLNNFVHFCTGLSYIPDIDLNEDFKIKVEFSYNEMTNTTEERKNDWIPIVHTCDRTIKIPGDAYDGNMETFLEKYSVSERLSAGSFDMQ